VVMANAPDHVRGLLTERGYTVSDVNLDPFILSGGGAYCMTLRLDRRSH
jgi:N-dimethylarginine dimethylaminohydrolase